MGDSSADAVASELEKLSVTPPTAPGGEKLKDVSPELLVKFFTQAIAKLKEEELRKDMSDELEAVPTEGIADSSLDQAKYQVVRKKLDGVYSAIWAEFNVDDDAASEAVMHAGETAASNDLSEEEQEKLSELIDEYEKTEGEFVGESILGKEEFENRMAKQVKFTELRTEVLHNLQTLKGEEASAYLLNLQKEGMEIQKKFQGMSNEEASKYFDNPSEEDETRMMRFQILSMLMEQQSGGGHGHSHGGQPCHGHGHESHGHSHESHGHSHGGEPCHGHGEPKSHGHSHESHGHSHDGKPCDGKH